jgi:MFS superfamily sulfate permease-like transporter
MEPRVRFDRHELAGAFGDLGTDLPLLVGLIVTCHLDPASVCVTYGLLQIATGLYYGIPMPVQPLKAMAAIMLAQKLSGGTYAAGGLVIGASMLLLASSGALSWLARVVPKEAVRGIQLGLGITLATLALKDYAADGGKRGYVVFGIALGLWLVLRQWKKVPAALVVVGLGAMYALVTRVDFHVIAHGIGPQMPKLVIPVGDDWKRGALLLALPQIPLSLGNSVLATSQVAKDLYPDRAPTVQRIGITYGVMNLVAPLFGGVPVCHGCGGMVGFHAFGARTGGAPVIYGAMYLVLGLVFPAAFAEVVRVFPLPLLGAILVVEAVGLMSMVRDVANDRRTLWTSMLVAACVVGLPYGYLVGLVVGTILGWTQKTNRRSRDSAVAVDRVADDGGRDDSADDEDQKDREKPA